MTSSMTPIRKPDGTPYRFLIVDDSEFVLKNLKMTIGILGAEVVGECKDGQQALELYKEHRPDLVTCDIVMPNMSGVDVVKQLVQFDPEARVIMVSSLGHRHMVEEAIGRGAKYFIVKPFRPAEAASTLESVIQKLFR